MTTSRYHLGPGKIGFDVDFDTSMQYTLNTSFDSGRPTHVGLEVMTPSGPVYHELISTESNKMKNCVVCRNRKVKTKSGWNVHTRHQCSVCRVALCRGQRGQRGCFFYFHENYTKEEQYSMI